VLSRMMDTLATILQPLIRGLLPVIRQVGKLAKSVVPMLRPIFSMLGSSLAMIAKLIKPIIPILMAVCAIFEVFASILTALTPIFDMAFRALFEVLRGVAMVVLGVVWAIGKVWNGIIGAIAGIVRLIGKIPGLGKAMNKFADTLDSMKMDTDKIEQSMQDLVNTTYESTKSNKKNKESVDEVTESMDTLTASLHNVPEGYKVTAARFAAMAAEGEMALGTAISPLDQAADSALDLSINMDKLNASIEEVMNTVDASSGTLGIQTQLGLGLDGGTSPGSGVIGFATGGVVTRPTRALIGEAGPEAVIPLGRLLDAIAAGGSAQATAPSQDLYIENLTVIADNPEQLMESLQAVSSTRAVAKTGLPLGVRGTKFGGYR
jgi:uncharacterized protein YoxC